jgi:hypothetical protein
LCAVRIEFCPLTAPGGVHEGLRYRYTSPIPHIPSRVAPALPVGPWELLADIERSDIGAEGVIFSYGGINGGLSLYVRGNRLHFEHNARKDVTVATSEAEIPIGRVSIGVRLETASLGCGTVTLLIGGEDAGTMAIPTLAGAIGRGGADMV